MLLRLKAEYNDLVNEILDKIPQNKLIHGKVLDPSMGGGQFMKEIERRKREAGLSLDKIKKTCYGYADGQLTLNYAINKHGLVGTYKVSNFLEEDIDMKFDVIVGNPPYQKTFDGERKAKRYNLWSEFLQKTTELSDKVALIIPDGWMSTGNQSFDLMKKYGIRYCNIHECSRHFRGVGVNFTYVILGRGYSGKTIVQTEDKSIQIDLKNKKIITPNIAHWNILDKLTIGDNKQGWRRGSGYHTSNKELFTESGKYSVFHTNAQSYRTNRVLGDMPIRKVYTTISGYYIPHYDNGNVGVTQATAVVEVQNLANAESVFSSKLYKFICGVLASQQGWINLIVLKSLSAVDLSRKWTDAELYKHFNLTKEEIDLIESRS